MASQVQNPLMEEFRTPHGVVPFHLLETSHYETAVKEGIRQHALEIGSICRNPQPPSFENTIVALEGSGRLLDRSLAVFENLLSAETNEQMEALANTLMPLVADHESAVALNEKLFQRVKEVYGNRDRLQLSAEEKMLLEETYGHFVRRGANLEGGPKKRFRELAAEASKLALSFRQNVLKETNDYELLLTGRSQLAGLPPHMVDAARKLAADRGKEGWMFTLSAPSYVPFMAYCEDRALRQQLYMAYNMKAARPNGCNNFSIIRQLVDVRMEMAQLLGYDNYAEYVLRHRMAGDIASVYRLLDQLREAYLPAAVAEVKEVEQLARRHEGEHFQLMPWDWSFYSEKLRREKFDLDTEMLRPYFELGRVVDGVFGLANRLYGISFRENKDIPVYHPDVRAYEVCDADGRFLAVLYLDFYPRAGKRAGAWMTEYKDQWKEGGADSRPHVSIVMNFTKPSGQRPALLSFDEVKTFLHEFGHALHGIFADTVYASLSGTHVWWDFVELPSQIMENFAYEKEFLHTFARHYETGELLPDALVQRIVEASNFNAGYACLRQLSFAYLDMAWHTRNSAFDGDVEAYEKAAWKPVQLLPFVEGTCMSAQFSHIFSGGYSAGYYSYKWAEVLEADAFSVFREKGIFSQEAAGRFRKEILSRGGTEPPMELYVRFRGKKPTIDALLEKNGLKHG